MFIINRYWCLIFFLCSSFVTLRLTQQTVCCSWRPYLCLGVINLNVLMSGAEKPYNQPVKCHYCTNTLWPHHAATRQNNALLQSMNKNTAWTYKHLNLSSVIGGMGNQEQDRKESEAIVEWPYRLSLWQGHYWTLGTHTHTHTEILQTHPQGL